jgi:transposase-like protein
MLWEVHRMGRKRPTYTPEFRAEAVRLFREGDKTLTECAQAIGVSRTGLSKWIRQAEIDEGKGPEGALTTSEREELQRLRRENRQVKMERDFLKKAAAFFARENS